MSADPELPPRLSFLDARAKARAVAAVKAFEAHTSAELVITVKREARAYPEADLRVGVLFAFATLVFLLFYPIDFSTTFMPLDTALGFGVGFGLSRMLPPLKRLALTKKTREDAALRSAKAAFVDLGVTKTSGRTGVLVYVALFERVVTLVCDVGVTSDASQAAEGVRAALEDAVARVDIRAFAEALERLGPSFGVTMPRSADDVNELSDEVA